MDDQAEPARAGNPFAAPQQAAQEAHERSLQRLRQFLTTLDPLPSSQAILGVAGTDRLIRDMRTEFGLLSATEVQQLLGRRRSDSRHEISRSDLIVFEYGGNDVYPGFQFDEAKQSVLTVIPELLRAAGKGRSALSLACWLCSPSGYLDGARPVDRLKEPIEVVEAALSHYRAQW